MIQPTFHSPGGTVQSFRKIFGTPGPTEFDITRLSESAVYPPSAWSTTSNSAHNITSLMIGTHSQHSPSLSTGPRMNPYRSSRSRLALLGRVISPRLLRLCRARATSHMMPKMDRLQRRSNPTQYLRASGVRSLRGRSFTPCLRSIGY